MERYSDRAIEIINELHMERLDYESEYLPLIDCANQCAYYEDTGLAPEEIERILDAYGRGRTLRTEIGERLEIVRGIPTDRLRELVKARNEGRVHIAPISDGTAIFYHIDDDENMFPEVEDGIFEGIYVNGYTEYICGEMGVGWFLTRAEAKAAIGGGQT